jgi:pseudouridine-5'-phosphate glycosidase/pseudouridine kinase
MRLNGRLDVRYLSQASTGAELKHPGTPKLPNPALMIFGSAAIDVQSRSPTKLFPRSTTPGSIFISPGGVARNMAEAAQALLPPGSVKLVYPAAKDLLGSLLHMEMESVGLRTDGLIEPLDASATAACSLILDPNGDLTGGVSDMTIVEGLTGESVSAISHDRM